jgi:predicted RNase H-like HicB family nuclease
LSCQIKKVIRDVVEGWGGDSWSEWLRSGKDIHIDIDQSERLVLGCSFVVLRIKLLFMKKRNFEAITLNSMVVKDNSTTGFTAWLQEFPEVIAEGNTSEEARTNMFENLKTAMEFNGQVVQKTLRVKIILPKL